MIRLFLILLAAISPAIAQAADRPHGPLNLPYADAKAWHLGFSVGIHAQDVRFAHTGFTTPEGETWFLDQPSYSPGFCVGGLVDFRLNDYFNIRLSPGLWFGNRNIRMVDTTHGGSEKQNMKSTFVVMPVDVKFSSVRYRNSKPYLTAGVMPAFDVSKKRAEFLKFNTTDLYLTFGLGCNFYLPFFKLNPEVKFCLGLTDVLTHKRPEIADDPAMMKITQSLKRATSRMIVLTFYFE